jgi:hypothetical protein
MSDNGAYIAIQRCGCITAIHLTGYCPESDTAKSVAGWIKDGLTVEHTTLAEAQARPLFLVAECPHDPIGWGPHRGEHREHPSLFEDIAA